MSEISRRVLCVDDDENLLTGLRRQLRGRYEATCALGPAAALEAIQKDGPFAIIVTDFNMPGMDGIELLRRVGELSPQTIRVMLTGRAELQIVVNALHDGQIFRFLNKPITREQLFKTLDDGLEQHRLIVSESLLKAELNRANSELRTLNENLERRVAERTETIRSLYQFVSDLNGLDSLAEVARRVVETTSQMLESERVSLMMPDASGEYLHIVAARGLDPEIQSAVRVPIGSPIAGIVFSDAREIIVNCVEGPTQDGRYPNEVFASSPLVCASLVASSRPVGVLNVTGRRTPYDSESLAHLRALAQAATIALMNQIRREERNEARDATILALAKLAEHRDPETGAHLERVQHYCRLLSETLSTMPRYASVIDRDFIDQIVRSSPLHDIGKVGIPDAVLLKPGKLSDAEFEIMKRHATIGGDTLKMLVAGGRGQTFLQMGMEIAYYHHEKYNGEGYPSGLAGEAIPLPARILALADVYDALTSKRVYKDAMPHEKAAAIIRGDSGTHFDPDVVEAFGRCEVEFQRLAAELADKGHKQPLTAPAPVAAAELVPEQV